MAGRGRPARARCRPAARRAGTAPGAQSFRPSSAASSTSRQLSSRHSTICFRRRTPGQRAERSEAERRGDVEVEQVGEAPAGGSLRRQAPEDVAEIAVGRELAAVAASLRPEALGQEKVGELPGVGETLSQACGRAASRRRSPSGDAGDPRASRVPIQAPAREASPAARCRARAPRSPPGRAPGSPSTAW